MQQLELVQPEPVDVDPGRVVRFHLPSGALVTAQQLGDVVRVHVKGPRGAKGSRAKVLGVSASVVEVGSE